VKTVAILGMLDWGAKFGLEELILGG